MAQGDLQAKVTANTTGFQAAMVDAATVAEREAKKAAAAAKTLGSYLKENAALAKEAANSAPYEKMVEDANKARDAHAGVNRELIVLAHEMSMGNYSRFGGSLMVLAERTDALHFAMSAAGAAAFGLGGLVLGAVTAIAMGAIESDKFAKSLQLTGNYAAVTAQSVRELASIQAAQTGQSLNAARATIEAAAGSGAFGPAALASVARAMGDYQRLTGEAADKALEKFSGLSDGVAKWAEEQNRQFHFITSAQYDQIKALEDSGSAERAAIMASNDLAQALESRGTPAVGAFAEAWHFVKSAVGDAIESMENIGKPTTLADHINDAQRQIGWAKSGNSGGSWDWRQQQIAEGEAKLATLRQQQFKELERSTDSAYAAMTNAAAIAAKKDVDEWLKRAKSADAYGEAIKKARAEFAVRADAGTPVSKGDQSSIEAEIKKQYADKSGQAQANEYANLVTAIKAYNAATAQEGAQAAKLTDADQWRLEMHKQLDDANKKLTASQRSIIGAMVDTAAASRSTTDMQLKDSAARLKAIALEATEQAEYEKKRYEGISALVQADNDQANAIIRETQLIGKNADEVKRLKALSQFDDTTAKQLVAAPDAETAREINRIATAMRTNLVDAIDTAKKAQDEYNASFSNGWAKAQSDYVKQAANSAAQGEKLFGDFTNGLEDAFVGLERTGKLNVKSMVDSWIADLARLETQKGFAALTSAAGGPNGIGSLLGAGESMLGLGGGTGAGSASFANLFSSDFGGPAFANGLGYVPYDGFHAVLHEGEKVSSRQDAALERSGARALHIDMSGQTINVGQGVSRAEVFAAVKQGNNMTIATMRRQLKTGGVVIG